MVKVSSIPQFLREVKELYGFLMSQEISISPLTPKDTTRMAKSFPSTYKFVNEKIQWTTPFYTQFVNDGTKKMKSRRFIQKNFHQSGEKNLKKAFRIVNKRWLGK